MDLEVLGLDGAEHPRAPLGEIVRGRENALGRQEDSSTISPVGIVRPSASRLLLDEILNLEDLRFGRELDAHVAEDGHQLLTVSLELLP